MDNINTYLKWRGDLSLPASAFNEADSLILSLISYVDFDGIVPGVGSEESITLKEASDIYWSKAGHDEPDMTGFLKKTALLFKEAAETKRFGSIRVCKYVNRIDLLEQEQFSATTFQLDDDSFYLAFRGTDTNIIGWKEDFNMSFIKEVPAQLDAARYLKDTFSRKYHRILLGGHSKGGNLSIYASIKCVKNIRDKIVSVHNFDGPGFSKEIVESAEYAEMLPRITNFLPRASIIGMLMENAGRKIIVKSSHWGGISQHDAFSWEVCSQGFSCLNEMDKSSLVMDKIIKSWVSKLDLEQRESFVDTLFGLLEHIGIERTTELRRLSNERIRSFIRSIASMPEERRQALAKFMKMFLVESSSAVKRELKDSIRLKQNQREDFFKYE